MIQYLKHAEIDKKKWDNCIEQAPNGLIYAYSWYLDVVSPGWDALVEGDYESVMPLTHRKKLCFNYLYQPNFCQQLGIFSIESARHNLVERFIESLPKKFQFVEVQLNESNQTEAYENLLSQKKTYILDLNKNYTSIKASYSQNHKRNIKKAYQNNFKLTSGLSAKEIVDFKRKNPVNDLKEFQYKQLEDLVKISFKKKIGKSLEIFDPNGEILAVAFFIFHKKRVYYILSATNETGKKGGAMFLIVDYFLQKYAGNPWILDFEGSQIPGLARFYSGFGATPRYYSKIKINNLPFPFYLLKS